MLNKNKRNAIIIVFLALILASGMVFYFDYRINAATQDYNAKLLDLAFQFRDNLQKTQNILQSQIGILGSNLSSEIGLIDASLQSFKKENQKEIEALSSLIDQIEQQSNIKLNELKDEVKNIQIKSADFSAIVNDVLQSVVSVKTNAGQGSGAIISSKGYAVTNVHVISGASIVRVVAYDERVYPVEEVAGYDSNADIAVLKINAQNLKALSFGNSDNVRVGEKVIAAGNPAGLAFTVTEGIVSAFRTAENRIKYIQTDVPINPGNSGGPLINTKGEIVGINNFKISGGFEGLGFAISSNDAEAIVNKIIRDYEAKQKQ